MNAAEIVIVAVVIAPIVLLLSFAGCGFDGVATGTAPDAEKPPPPPAPPEPPAGPVTPPGNTEVPVVPPNPAKYHDLVLKGATELIAYWKLDDTVANAAALDSGPSPLNPGIYRGGVSAADGVLRLGPDPADRATSFDGATAFINVAYDTLMNPVSNTNFSLEAWILPDPTATGRQVVAGSYRVNASSAIDRGFALELIGGATPRVRVRTAPDGQAEAPLTGGVSGWHHVVLTYEATAKRLRLYVNGTSPAGAVDAPAAYTANRQVAPTDVATPLRIGAGQREPFDQTSPPALFFRGRIDQVALYRGALPATAIAAHFAAATTL